MKKYDNVDFTSLYPYINKMGIYPIGHPEIIGSDFKNISEYFGIAKVTILPPRDLHLPILPVRAHNKLMFVLCISCTENMSHSCNCMDEDRALTGCWTTLKIEKALSLNYKLLKIHEVYHFTETSQYEPHTKSGGIFTDYVNTFLRLKQQASDVPSHVNTDKQLDEYISYYEEKEGITLHKHDIVENKGLRQISKLMLNSLWGKTSQNILPQSTIIDSGVDFLNIMFDRSKQIEDFAQIDLSKKHDFAQSVPNTDIFIAIFTTAQARLKTI